MDVPLSELYTHIPKNPDVRAIYKSLYTEFYNEVLPRATLNKMAVSMDLEKVSELVYLGVMEARYSKPITSITEVSANHKFGAAYLRLMLSLERLDIDHRQVLIKFLSVINQAIGSLSDRLKITQDQITDYLNAFILGCDSRSDLFSLIDANRSTIEGYLKDFTVGDYSDEEVKQAIRFADNRTGGKAPRAACVYRLYCLLSSYKSGFDSSFVYMLKDLSNKL